MNAYKSYKFHATNWKSSTARTFTFYRKFPSAYYADRWASRIFTKPKSPYIVTLCPGEER